VHYELICEGKCKDADDKDCVQKKETVTGQHTEEIEYCCCNGCDGGETSGCHIVLRTGGKLHRVTKMKCRGNSCAAGEECVPVPAFRGEVPIPDDDGNYTGKMGQWIEFRCECKPKRETWGHWM
jgi:hypothetical protein